MKKLDLIVMMTWCLSLHVGLLEAEETTRLSGFATLEPTAESRFFGETVATSSDWLVAGGFLVKDTGTREIVFQILESDGSLRTSWSYPTTENVNAFADPLLAITTNESKLVTVHREGGSEQIRCHRAEDGILLWSKTIAASPYREVTVTSNESYLFISPHQSSAGEILVIDWETGDIVTTLTASEPSFRDQFGEIMVASDDYLVVSNTGLDVFDIGDWENRRSFTNPSPYSAQRVPGIYGDKCLIADGSSWVGHFYVVDLLTGDSHLPTVENARHYGTISATDNYIVAIGSGRLDFCDPLTYQVLHHVSLPSLYNYSLSFDCGPRFVVVGNLVYRPSYGPSTAGSVSIFDSQPDEPLLTWSATTSSERERLVTIRFLLKDPAENPVAIAFRTRDGSAVAGSDFQGVTTTLTIPIGQQEAEFNITLLQDLQLEKTEDFELEMTSLTGAVVESTTLPITIMGSSLNKVGQFERRDVPPTFRNDYAAAEGSRYSATASIGEPLGEATSGNFNISVFDIQTNEVVWEFTAPILMEPWFTSYPVETYGNKLIVPIGLPKSSHWTQPVPKKQVLIYDIPSQTLLTTFYNPDSAASSTSEFGRYVDVAPPYLLVATPHMAAGFQAYHLENLTPVFLPGVASRMPLTFASDGHFGFGLSNYSGSTLTIPDRVIYDFSTGGAAKVISAPEPNEASDFAEGGAVGNGVAWVSGGPDEALMGFNIASGEIEQTIQPPVGTDYGFNGFLHLHGELLFYGYSSPYNTSSQENHLNVYSTSTGALLQTLSEGVPRNSQLPRERFGRTVSANATYFFIAGFEDTIHVYSRSPKPSLTLLNSEIQEGQAFPSVVGLSNEPFAEDWDVTVALAPGNVTLGSDFGLPLPVTLGAGRTSHLIPLPLLDDSVDEGEEFAVLTVSDDFTELGTTSVTIRDDDSFPESEELLGPNLSYQDLFGFDFDLNSSRVYVGQPVDAGSNSNGKAYVYDRETGNLLDTLASSQPILGSLFGSGIAANEEFFAVSQPGNPFSNFSQGTVTIYRVSDNQVIRTLSQGASDTLFGGEVVFSGEQLVVSNPGNVTGTAKGYLIFVDPATGTVSPTIRAPGDTAGNYFGDAVQADAQDVLVGSPGHDAAGTNAGSTFLLDSDTHDFVLSLTSPNPAPEANFGSAVALGTQRLLVSDDLDTVYCFDRQSGSYLWSRSAPESYGDATIVEYGAQLTADGDLFLVTAAYANTRERESAGLIEVLDGEGHLVGVLNGPSQTRDGEEFGFHSVLDNNEAWVSIPGSENGERRTRLEVYQLPEQPLYAQWLTTAEDLGVDYDFDGDGQISEVDYLHFLNPGWHNFSLTAQPEGDFFGFDLPNRIPADIAISLETTNDLVDWLTTARLHDDGIVLGDADILTETEQSRMIPLRGFNEKEFFRVRIHAVE
ncbi:MAG: Calx-beta domain-containing protein [Roseibacillus sp.]